MNNWTKTRRFFRERVRLSFATIGCVSATLVPGTSFALQPLSTFVEHAKATNPSNREADATVRLRAAETASTTADLLPSFDARGTYTRNQYEAIISLPSATGGAATVLTVQPRNQLDGSLKITLPIIDVGAWERRAAAKTTEATATANRQATELDVERRVTRAYYQVLGAEALLASAQRTQQVAEKTVLNLRTRRENGVASELDLQRAIAQVASDRQDVASADYNVTQYLRNLQSLSGVKPTRTTDFVEEDLREEPPLESFLGPSVNDLPVVRSALKARIAAEQTANAARLRWLPTVSTAAEERFTNATGFVGRNQYYLLTATATWHIDFGVPAAVRQRDAQADAARAREEQARLDAADAIFDAWHQIRVDIEKARSARAGLAAATLALDLAQDRYLNGVATQLDVLQAQRDAFQADVSRIQADSDLAYARAALRISATRAQAAKENQQ